MTQAANERCIHGLLRGMCVCVNCAHYDGLGAEAPAERPKRISEPPKPVEKPARKEPEHPQASVLSFDLIPFRRRVQRITQLVAEQYGLDARHVLGRDRHRSVAEARLVLSWLCRNGTEPQWSYPEIGRALGRDHTTIMSACKKVDLLFVSDPDFSARVSLLLRQARTLEEQRWR